MPQGVILAGRVDDRAWLTGGAGAELPLMYNSATVLACPAGPTAPVRMGVFVPAASSAARAGPADAGNENTGPGWTIAPKGQELQLRMCGLLWPEAAERLANSAYVTRERIGSGQVILFASDPNFRAGALGTRRLFSNAIVLGPGMGASQPIKP